MRIALDATYSVDRHPSGIAIYSRALLDGLAEAHPEATFVHCYRPKQWLRRSASRSGNVRTRLLLSAIPLRADIFHALNQRVDRRRAKAVIATFHDLFVMTEDYSSPEFRARFTQQARRAADLSDFIIAVSEFTAAQVRELLGFPAERIRVVPHGISTLLQYGDAVVAREKMVLFVGAIQRRKNVSALIEAFAALPNDWRLVLAGSASGYGAEEILQRLEASPARSRIEVKGYVSSSELARLYRQASIFAFPSLAEGFGMPVLEAMAYGVPVLTSNSSALWEVAGDAAVLVDPAATDSIAEGLQQLAADGALRSQLVRRGLTRVEQFSWRRSCDATYAVYEEALRTGS